MWTNVTDWLMDWGELCHSIDHKISLLPDTKVMLSLVCVCVMLSLGGYYVMIHMMQWDLSNMSPDLSCRLRWICHKEIGHNRREMIAWERQVWRDQQGDCWLKKLITNWACFVAVKCQGDHSKILFVQHVHWHKWFQQTSLNSMHMIKFFLDNTNLTFPA